MHFLGIGKRRYFDYGSSPGGVSAAGPSGKIILYNLYRKFIKLATLLTLGTGPSGADPFGADGPPGDPFGNTAAGPTGEKKCLSVIIFVLRYFSSMIKFKQR